MNENFSTRLGQVEVKQVKKATPNSAAMDVVSLDGHEFGIIMKYRNTKTEKFPWLAILGIGHAQRSIGHFWESRHAAVLALLDDYTGPVPCNKPPGV